MQKAKCYFLTIVVYFGIILCGLFGFNKFVLILTIGLVNG